MQIHRAASPVLLVILAGCTGSGDRITPPDWSAGYASSYVSPVDTSDTTDTADTGDTVTIEPLQFGASPPSADDLGYVVRAADRATGEDCLIDVAGTTSGYQDLECMLDHAELNLFGSGLIFDFTVPEGACDYLAYDFYMYEAWEVGAGPTQVSYTRDPNGNLIDRVNVDDDGTPLCDYNYSYADVRDPNCCLGSYTLTVTDQRLDAKTGALISEDSVYTRGWGGDIPECYGGAAFEDPEVTFSAEGWPTGKIVHLAGAPFSKRFAWDAPSARFSTNVPLANHYDVADHDTQAPAGLRGAWARPYYTFECYDNAEELLARVRLVVREWNEESEFDAVGDPDTEGTEPVSGTPLNDRQDWADATPGADTFIQDRQ